MLMKTKWSNALKTFTRYIEVSFLIKPYVVKAKLNFRQLMSAEEC